MKKIARKQTKQTSNTIEISENDLRFIAGGVRYGTYDYSEQVCKVDGTDGPVLPMP